MVRNHHHCSSIFTIQGKVTGVIWRVVTPKDKKRNPSPLTKFYEEKNVNVIRRSKYYYILNLCSFHMRMFLPNNKDCIFFSSFEVKVILLVSSVKTLCLWLINFCCIFSISLLFFMNSLKPSTLFLFWIVYFIFNLSCLKTVFIMLKLSFSIYDTFLWLVLFFPHHCCLLNSYVFALNPTNSFMICPSNSSFITPITFLFFLLGNSLSDLKFEVSNLVSTSPKLS